MGNGVAGGEAFEGGGLIDDWSQFAWRLGCRKKNRPA